MRPGPDRTWLERLVGRLIPSRVPLSSRRTFAHEMGSTIFFTLAIAMIEGGVVAVFARQSFDGDVPQGRLNFAVALLGSMSELANILSFIWSSWGSGRRLVPFINALQLAVIALVAAIALLPDSPSGLALLVALVLAARLCWSGIVTMRTGVWRANYPPFARASVVGMLSSAQVLIVAAAGATMGWVLDHDPDAFRKLVPVACAVALGAVWSYGRIRVRRERMLLRESSGPLLKPWEGPLVVWNVLRQDRRYAQFMLCMFVLGFGNLMLTPILVISLREQFGFGYFNSILITSSIPAVVQLAVIPLWAMLLDRSHIVRFRSVHSWVFVLAAAVFFAAAATGRVGLMYLGSAVMGCAYAGGALAWNLGHVDFSPPAQTSRYMATHVTLNGVRGLIAPLVSVSLLETAKAAGLPGPASMLALAFVVNAAGAAGFVMLRRSMEREMALARMPDR